MWIPARKLSPLLLTLPVTISLQAVGLRLYAFVKSSPGGARSRETSHPRAAAPRHYGGGGGNLTAGSRLGVRVVTADERGPHGRKEGDGEGKRSLLFFSSSVFYFCLLRVSPGEFFFHVASPRVGMEITGESTSVGGSNFTRCKLVDARSREGSALSVTS